jgi:hypothetical protein
MGPEDTYRLERATSAGAETLQGLGRPADPALLVALVRHEILAAYGSLRERRPARAGG